MEFGNSTSFSGHVIAFTPISLGVLLLGVAVILFGQRKWVLPTFIALSILMSMALNVMVAGENFMSYRILLLFAWTRFFMRGEHRGLQLSGMDRMFIFLQSWIVIAETLRDGWPGFVFGVANNFYDALGIYFLCRILIREKQELLNIVKCLMVLSVVLGASMAVEFVSGRNLLSVLGAVQDVVVERKGRPRCAGPFLICITAGTFGALLLPMFVALWRQDRSANKSMLAGCVGSTIITITSGSAGPLGTYATGVLGLLAWPLRNHMHLIRRGTLVSLVILHFLMKAPVWALVARIQLVPGASAWHRFNVIDGFVNNVGQWWLIGASDTRNWGWFVDDVANQFCIIAKHGGMLGLILFIWVLVLGFREVGLRMREVEHDPKTGFLIWSFGVMLFAHMASFFGISYYDQTKVFWYLSLAMVASLKLLTQAEQQAAKLGDEAPAADAVPQPV